MKVMDSPQRLLSVQVGRPRSIPQGERTVRTAIYKEPVLFRVRVRRLNLDGDSQADLRVHGGPDKAVYAYDHSGYEHWRHKLGLELPFGQFGENLTVEGMPESFVNADPRFTPDTTTYHLREEGIPHCVPAFGWGAWSDAPTYVSPAQYLGMWAGPYAVYFGDSREQQYGEWH